MNKPTKLLFAGKQQLRILLLGIISLAIPACLHATGNAVPSAGGIVIESSSGEDIEIRLSDSPRFTFDGLTVTVSTESSSVEYTAKNISKVFFESNTTDAISTPTNQRTSMTFNGTTVGVSGAKAGSLVKCYTTDGILVATAGVNNDGSATLSLENLSARLLIISIDDKSFKISRK